MLQDLSVFFVRPFPKSVERLYHKVNAYKALRDLGTGTVFTIFDLKSEYWQTHMEPKSLPYPSPRQMELAYRILRLLPEAYE